MRKINMKRKNRKEKVERQSIDEENGVDEEKSNDPKNSSDEEAATKSESDAEPEPKKRKSDKRKSVSFTNKKAVKKEDKDTEEDDAQYEVEEVLDEKVVRGVRHYLIRWKGYESESDSWEPESTLKCAELIKRFKVSRDEKKKSNDQNFSDSPDKGKKGEKDKFKYRNKQGKKKTQKTGPEVDWESGDEFEVGSILDVYFKRSGSREFLVSWKGYPHSQDSWEPEENLDCTDLINKFMNKVEAAKQVDQKELRVKRTPTERFTLNMYAGGGAGRRLSRRLSRKQRVQYHDAE